MRMASTYGNQDQNSISESILCMVPWYQKGSKRHLNFFHALKVLFCFRHPNKIVCMSLHCENYFYYQNNPHTWTWDIFFLRDHKSTGWNNVCRDLQRGLTNKPSCWRRKIFLHECMRPHILVLYKIGFSLQLWYLNVVWYSISERIMYTAHRYDFFYHSSSNLFG